MAFSSQSCSPGDESCALPQYGFGAEFEFDNLVKRNPFLFRVYTPKQRSPFFDNTDPFFIGPKFDEQFTLASQELPKSTSLDPISLTSTYDDVARHMDWSTRSSSPYISTSFSFIWSVWEALRRYRTNVKHDIEIAIIDATAVSEKAVTALQLLRKSTPKERHRDYWRWYRFSQESQSVLVHGAIPGTAVYASIPLRSLIEKLPSYFLQSHRAYNKESPLDQVAWNYTGKKASYRKFCQNMSDRFLALPAELRLRDTTAGSVRLAAAFLRPWFHKIVMDDFQAATLTMRNLSFVIAQWPGQWWARDHGEMWDLIRAMVLVLGEEVREKQRGEVLMEVGRLREIVDNLEQVVKNYESQSNENNQVARRLTGSSLRLMPSRLRISSVLPELPAPSLQSVRRTRPVRLILPAPSTAPTSALPSPPLTPSQTSPQSQPPSPQKLLAPPVPPAPVPSASSTEVESTVRPHSMVETASCIVTGFLFGAFITLCIMSPQRRTLLIHLT